MMQEEKFEEKEKIEIVQRFPSWKEILKPSTEMKKGFYSYAATLRDQEYLNLPFPREWSPLDEDWKLPENWKEILINKIDELRKKYRSFQVFMDICVRCGACADKCHYYIGTGDPKNMPVIRGELLRTIYRRYFTKTGKLFGEWAGARELTEDVIKEWYLYFYQCSECRRCSVFCPYGIDTAEITMLARELLNAIGISQRFSLISAAACVRTGNHLGLSPGGVVNSIRYAVDDIKEITGIDVEVPVNKKGAEILFVTPSGDYFAQPHWFTFIGYIMVFHELGLDYTFSTYAAEGGNFGFFHSFEVAKKINQKIYKEAKRLGVKWILGGECGHMWRVKHQYMATYADETYEDALKVLEEPVNPITGTVFENASSTKMVHILEFLADVLKHKKLKIDKSRNDHLVVTHHDSCNIARGMGLYEEPRFVIKSVCNHYYDMPDHAIREKSYCCGSGAGLLADELMELRMRGGMPRAMAVKYVHEKYGVNHLTAACAIDRAAFPTLLKFWRLPVQMGGITELVANAMIMKGEKERDTDLRGNPLGEYLEVEI
ncbi:MAG: (Fe-S)-binding protein [Archaeoglobus sp.]|nr:(Fe-S)-binding protein [Archaeoglobus sp.]